MYRFDCQRNKEQLKLAEAICAKRIIDLRNSALGFRTDELSEAALSAYLCKYIERNKDLWAKSTLAAWMSLYKHIIAFAGDRTTIGDVDRAFAEQYMTYLSTHGNHTNAVRQHIIRLRSVLREAVREGILIRNPLEGFKVPKMTVAKREHLTIDELRRLIDTPCANDVIRRAFLFSCLVGMRFSDIKELEWHDVRENNGMTRIVFRQRKTRGLEYLDITPQAEQYLGARRADNVKVFDIRCSRGTMLSILSQWVADAGIHKRITFHCARHTFAVMMISLGADIYTVSKLLGHSHVGTTQEYTKLLDTKKREAVNMIPRL